MRTFEFKDGKSHKFWHIDLKDKQFTVTYGRVGAKGQTQEKDFPTAAAAQAAHDKLIAEKLAKGYVETVAQKPTPPSPLQKSLEKAIIADPDDLGAHSAYADYLIEQNDPRGEFIQVQLALEDASRSAAERKELQQREKALLKTYGRKWLGDLAPFLMDGVAVPGTEDDDAETTEYRYQFERGWLGNLEVARLSMTFAEVLATAPQAFLLRRLSLQGWFYDDEPTHAQIRKYRIGTHDGFPSLYPLISSPILKNVRVFSLGEDQGDDWEAYRNYCNGRLLPELVKRMPRLEELYVFADRFDPAALFKLKNLTSLRILKIYHMDAYPLVTLSKNASLGSLTHLLLHPHFHRDHYMGAAADDDTPEAYITLEGLRAIVRSPHLKSLTHLRLRVSDAGDPGAVEIVNSGILKRLKMLDLRHGRITDVGAHVLATCPDIVNLELLDIERNGLKREGIQTLRNVLGKRVLADHQQSTKELAGSQYLCEGESE